MHTWQWFLHSQYAHPAFGTVAAVIAALSVYYAGRLTIYTRTKDDRDRYRQRQAVLTIVVVLAMVAIVIMWISLVQRAGTFFGLIGAGLTVAMKEPLLSIAGRIAILGGHIYTVGDRIEVDKITGDVIDVGFFYTRMLDLGNWIGGDQANGRIVQFSNSKIFGEHAVFNYTRNFRYIWDEVMLPITYASNMKAATEILLAVGGEYSEGFLQGAQADLEKMRNYFLVPSLELKPQVYVEVNSNWVQLTMRYVVEPKKRRQARTFIFSHVFERVQGRDDITISSETMDIAVHMEKKDETSSSERAQESASEGGPREPGLEAA